MQTLQDLHSDDPGRPLALLIGADAFAGLSVWHRWEQLFTLAHFVVVERPGEAFDVEALPATLKVQWERRLTTDPARISRQLAGAIVRVAVTPQSIAATTIRAAIARGAAGQLRGLLPAAVLAYIDRNHLYRSASDASI